METPPPTPSPKPTPASGSRTTFEIPLDRAAAIKLRDIWRTHGGAPEHGLFALIRFTGTEDASLRGLILDAAPRSILSNALGQIRTTTAHHELGEL